MFVFRMMVFKGIWVLAGSFLILGCEAKLDATGVAGFGQISTNEPSQAGAKGDDASNQDSKEQTSSITFTQVDQGSSLVIDQTRSCDPTAEEVSLYSCTTYLDDPDPGVTYSWVKSGLSTCYWLNVSDSANGVFSGTPSPDDLGECKLIYSITNVDSNEISEMAKVVITVVSVPLDLTVDGAPTLMEGSGSTIVLSGAEVRANKEGYGIFSLVAAASQSCETFGSISIDEADGALTFLPDPNYSGSCNVNIQFTDQQQPAESVNQEVSIIVTPVNDAPVILQPCAGSILEDAVFSCSPTYGDLDGPSPGMWRLAASNSCGWASIDSASGLISGTPTNSDVGSCSLEFVVNDGLLDSLVATANIITTNVSPTLVITTAGSITEDTPAIIIKSAATVQASDEGSGVYSLIPATALDCQSNGTVTIDSSTGAVTFAPDLNSILGCNINVQFDDMNPPNNLVSSEFTVIINSVNDLAVITESCAITGLQDSPYTCLPSQTDVDGPGVYTWSFGAGHTCSWMSISSGTGAISGTPSDSNVGSCVLEFGVNDGLEMSALVNRSINILNLQPTLTVADAASILEDSPNTLLRSNAEVQSNEETFGVYSVVAASAADCGSVGTVTLDVILGAVSFAPGADYNGTCNIKIQFDDENTLLNTVSAEFSVTVTPVNDIPLVYQTCLTSTNEGIGYTCYPTVNDVDGTGLESWSLAASNTCSWAVINPSTGVITGTPANNQVGTCSLEFVVNDGLVDSSTEIVTLSVSNVTPTLTILDAPNLAEDSTATIIRSDADVSASDEPSGVYSLLAASSSDCQGNGIVGIDSSTGAVTFTPAADYNGSCQINVQFDDGNATLNIVSSEFSVIVDSVNDAPIVSEACTTAVAEDAAYLCTPSVADVDLGDTQSWVLSSPDTTCMWAVMDSQTGAISGVPNDGDVGSCNLVFFANDGSVDSNISTVAITVSNVAPTLVIASAPDMWQAGSETIRADADVAASDQGYGVYTNVVATAPDCSDNGVLTVNSLTGQVDFAPLNTFIGTCNVKVQFDDGNAPTNLVAAEFAITVLPTQAVLTVSPTAINNLDSVGGIPTTGTITATNSGTGPSGVILDLHFIPSSNGFFVSQDNCVGKILAPGESCTIQVQLDAKLNGTYTADHRVIDGIVGPMTTLTGSVSGVEGGSMILSSASPSKFSAWESVGVSLASTPADLKQTPISAALGLDAREDGVLATNTGMVVGELASHLFEFDFSGVILPLRITGTIRGGGDDDYCAYYWNNQTSAWVAFDICSATSAVVDHSFSLGVNPSDLLDANSKMHLAVFGSSSASAATFDRLKTDFVTASVEGIASLSLSGFVINGQDAVASDGVVGDVCGSRSAVDGNVMVVACDGAFLSGAAYVYRHDGVSWNFEAKLTIAGAVGGDRFGGAVAVSGDLIAVSARGRGGVGAVFLYRNNGTAWAQEAEVTPSIAADVGYFGIGVSLFGNTLLVGSYLDTVAGIGGAGAAYIFRYDGGNWVEGQRIVSDVPTGFATLGNFVEIHGHSMFVYAGFEMILYIFRFDGAAWVLEQKIAESARDNGLRPVIAATGTRIAFAQPAGIAIYDYDPTLAIGSRWQKTDTILRPATASENLFGESIALRGDTLAVGATDSLAAASGGTSGGAYIFKKKLGTWALEQKVTPRFGHAQDYYGSSISLSASHVIVGAKNNNLIGAAFSTSLYPEKIDQVHLDASDRNDLDTYGRSVATSGNIAVVGAPGHTNSTGAAYIMEYSSGKWRETAILFASDKAAGDEFGFDVDIEDGRIIIGAPYDDDITGNSGSAYIFTFNGSSWVQTAKLTQSSPTVGDLFGSSVSISKNYALVGAPKSDGAAADSGVAYFYNFNGSAWGLLNQVSSASGATGDSFGDAVDLFGGYGVVGSPKSAGGDGKVHVYQLDISGSIWSESTQLQQAVSGGGDNFGVALELSGQILVAGASYANGNSGEAYVYRLDGTVWTQESLLTASDVSSFDYFGQDVSIDHDKILIGAFSADQPAQTGAGAAYYYRYNPGTTSWQEVRKVTTSRAEAVGRLGRSVAISGDTAIIGAPLHDLGGNDQGEILIFDLP